MGGGSSDGECVQIQGRCGQDDSGNYPLHGGLMV